MCFRGGLAGGGFLWRSGQLQPLLFRPQGNTRSVFGVTEQLHSTFKYSDGSSHFSVCSKPWPTSTIFSVTYPQSVKHTVPETLVLISVCGWPAAHVSMPSLCSALSVTCRWARSHGRPDWVLPFLDPSCSHAAHVVTLTSPCYGLVLLTVMKVKCTECFITFCFNLQKWWYLRTWHLLRGKWKK